jgi:hypothetical protein
LLRILFDFDSTYPYVYPAFTSYETTPKWHSFFPDQTGRFLGQRPRLYETTSSFFNDQTGRSLPEAALRKETDGVKA